MQNISRRSFTYFGAVTLASLSIGGLGLAAKGTDELLRPPGAASNERDFLALCLKCDRCRSVCPQNCISIAVVGEGFLNARSPKLDMHKGYCDFCGKCIEVCATDALKSFDPATDKIGMAVIQRDRCLAFDYGCNNCAESCEYDALAFVRGIPTIDESSCTGCGKCEYDCTALVFGNFQGGTRRGVQVVRMDIYEKDVASIDIGTDDAAAG